MTFLLSVNCSALQTNDNDVPGGRSGGGGWGGLRVSPVTVHHVSRALVRRPCRHETRESVGAGRQGDKQNALPSLRRHPERCRPSASRPPVYVPRSVHRGPSTLGPVSLPHPRSQSRDLLSPRVDLGRVGIVSPISTWDRVRSVVGTRKSSKSPTSSH